MRVLTLFTCDVVKRLQASKLYFCFGTFFVFFPYLLKSFFGRCPGSWADKAFMTGFEAVLVALYGAETKARGGKPVMINVPDLGHASIYHSPPRTIGSPQPVSRSHPTRFTIILQLLLSFQIWPYLSVALSSSLVLIRCFGWPQHVEMISPAMEPQTSVTSSQRAVIIGGALELFCKRIISMPSRAKLDLCHYARRYVESNLGITRFNLNTC